MSLAAESPLHSSSSSDDLAAFIEAELELTSSDTSPNDQLDDDEENDVEEQRIKRLKVESIKELQGSVMERNQENIGIIGTSKNLADEDSCPPHPGFYKGLCLRCGQLVEDDGPMLSLDYITKDLKLGTRESDRQRKADLKKLLREKKLILILDLDHTLLNSTRLVDVSMEEEYLLSQADSIKDDPKRSLFKLDAMHMLTKLRPFVHTFLKEANTMFEMYIYTMAERSYALEIAKLLDPEKVYFNCKVISQADCTQRHQKGLDVVLGAENVVLILDDTEFVWQKHKENLILMERYHYFSSSCRQFGFSAKSLSELMKDERESNGALATILNVLKRAHQMFFDPVLGTDLSSRDVRQVLKDIRREILQGCKIVFSRIFPSKSEPEDQPIWKLAEQLGATCCTDVDVSITHVVSTDAGTQKAQWALQNEKFLVNPRWIEAANYLWCRQQEEDFLIGNSRNT
ncbi:RNA polymerase II C-terminal domain phosphatase-like 4 isoform X2 [Elaeis guineensis]|nr:RNA polymerase II C-terminal domain phosphatase-like 4 isoform X2 [Elaeis guineensis]XP_010928004.1 RNA polymerase II C-terminal domain phosphatase-like 4 isoform X2 [Elaeis guineensis]XP_010928005.1 RNA polymerase II C-terminal domain phosphatase-like 4 isoform X2 [Elaeis guineensis]XP_029121892.1 RNA polymerase II C-terminal domain phosphatase-like 4 isoform X2 [Elaeis guineensis]